jgi:hypothetical protein
MKTLNEFLNTNIKINNDDFPLDCNSKEMIAFFEAKKFVEIYFDINDFFDGGDITKYFINHAEKYKNPVYMVFEAYEYDVISFADGRFEISKDNPIFSFTVYHKKYGISSCTLEDESGNEFEKDIEPEEFKKIVDKKFDWKNNNY